MGPLSGPAFILVVCLCIHSCFAYMEALGANAGTDMGKFEPMVAFMCNKPAMHKVVNGWEADHDTDCIEDPDDILEYCKKMYPDHDITNVIDDSRKVSIPDWPRFENKGSSGNHTVMVYKCLVGDFESEALLVPQHCIFDHEHDADLCEQPPYWRRRASDACHSQNMELESTGMLVVCKTDRFRGVEYVCCPKVTESEEEDSSESTDDNDEDKDDYTLYLRGDDLNKYDNEHKKFKAAEKSMKKRQHGKVTKMMKSWQEAREEVSEKRKIDKGAAEQLNKEITERFQRMYHAFEQEAESEKKQLTALHLQRVQGAFNKKKRLLKAAYKDELESDEPREKKVLSYLKQYIRVEEKDRLHTANHYEHLRDTDPQEAMKIRDSSITHLRLITERINDAINMLDRVPELASKIKPQIAQFRRSKFRNIEISTDDVVMKPVDILEPKEVPVVMPIDTKIESSEESVEIEGQGRDYTNIRIDTEGLVEEDNRKTFIANAQSNGAEVQQQSFSDNNSVRYSTTNVVGITIGSVAVFIIIIVAVVMLRKKSRRQPITHGFVEVDPAASPEERHVANMQMNGYENPTYRYFEMSTS